MATKDPNAAAVPARAVDKLRVARAQKAHWAEAEADARRELLDALNGKSVGTVRGAVVVTVTTSKTSRLDTKALRQHEPEIAALYTTQSPVTTVKLVDNGQDDDDGE